MSKKSTTFAAILLKTLNATSDEIMHRIAQRCRVRRSDISKRDNYRGRVVGGGRPLTRYKQIREEKRRKRHPIPLSPKNMHLILWR